MVLRRRFVTTPLKRRVAKVVPGLPSNFGRFMQMLSALQHGRARIWEKRVVAQAGACSSITRRWKSSTSALWLVEGKRLASNGQSEPPRSGQTSLQTKTSASISSTPWRKPDTMSMDVWKKVDSGIDMRRTESAQSRADSLLD